MTVRIALAVTLTCLALGGCGDDEGREPGTELGPCVEQQFCESPLMCVDGTCVHPDQGTATSGASVGDAPSSVGDATSDETGGGIDDGGTGSASADDGGADVYCSQGDADACLCGHTADWGPLGAPCSESTVDSPALCCGSDGWPAYGGCSCWTISCRQLSPDTCYCGLGSPDVADGDDPVDSCTAPEGICCSDGNTCTCWTDLTQCLDDAQPVGSCSVSDLGCGADSQRLEVCN